MKKIILSVAVLAMAASCSKTEVTEIAPSLQNEIGFSNLNDRVTKVANTNAVGSDGTAGTNSDYTVYAYETSNTTANTWYIPGATVSSLNALTGDFTGFHYYWPSTGSLNFLAFAPAATSDGNIAVTPSTTIANTVDLVYTVGSTAAEDFTIATPITAATSTGGTGGTVAAGKVSLVFSHMLAKATIAVKLEGEGEGDEILDGDSQGTGVYANTGVAANHTFTLGSATFTPAKDVLTVSLAAAGITGVTSASTDVADGYSYTIGSTTAATSLTSTQELMFAPQVAADDTVGSEVAADVCTITLTDLVIKNDGGATVYSGSPVYTFPDTNHFDAGTAYAITITISASDTDIFDTNAEITFDASITTSGWGSTASADLDDVDNDDSIL